MRRFLFRGVSLFLLMLILGGCALPFVSQPTPIPEAYLPTVVAMTAAAVARETLVAASPPTATFTPLPDTPTPSLTPTPLPTFTPTPPPQIPLAPIRILSPGPMSRVVSPIVVKTELIPGADGKFRIELIGKDGAILARELIHLVSYLPTGAYITQKLSFEIRGDAELARLQIITEDEYGRIQAQTSEHVLLLSLGENQLNIPDAPEARCFLSSPRANEDIHAGTLSFRGEFVPFNESPLVVELLDEAGKPLATKILYMDGMTRQPISGTLTYTAEETIHARIVVRQADDEIPGLMQVCTQPVILHP